MVTLKKGASQVESLVRKVRLAVPRQRLHSFDECARCNGTHLAIAKAMAGALTGIIGRSQSSLLYIYSQELVIVRSLLSFF